MAGVVALQVAAVALLVRLVGVWLGHTASAGVWPVLLLGVAALVLLISLAVDPAEHVRVRLRRLVDVIEAFGVVALFPLTPGVFGIYARLLGAF